MLRMPMDVIRHLKDVCSVAKTSQDPESLLGEVAGLIAGVVGADEHFVYQIDTMRFSATHVAGRAKASSEDACALLLGRGAFMSVARRVGQSLAPIHWHAGEGPHEVLKGETIESLRNDLGVKAFLWEPVPYGTSMYFLMIFNRQRSGKEWHREVRDFLAVAGDIVATSLLKFSATGNYRKALEELQVQKTLYQSVVEDQTELVCRHLPDGTLTFVNDAFCRYFRKSKEDLVGTSLLSRIYFSDVQRAESAMESLSTQNPLVGLEARVVAADGSLRWLHWVDRAVYDHAGALIGMQAVGRDITEQKDLEKQLIHAKKMESIGTMAGGIAHDFNNFLTSISGCAQLLRMDTGDGELRKDLLDQIISSSETASVLVRDLLTFSRKSRPNRRILDLNEAVRESAGLLSSLLSEGVGLELNLAEGTLTVLADDAQITQMLMNLATNARDAMPTGGTLTLRTHRITIAQDEVRSWGYGSPGEYAVMMVSDTGAGMDAETKERIFEPFFTTKGLGKGTGLGLSIVYGIIKEHEAYIRCESQPGRGTVFSIYIPLLAEE
ncbi:MAG TPA: ATP-binding protein [Dissulfurispiraceae bacterium]|nr:ATP-binding protein [Dissulfurispiraceae bacterium]